MRKGIMATVLFMAGLQLALAAGAGEAAASWLEEAITSGKLVTASLRYEHGRFVEEPSGAPELFPAPTDEPAPEAPEPSEELPAAPASELPRTAAADYSAVRLDNATSLSLDPPALMAAGLSLTLPADAPQILIIHTHSTEAYTPEPGDEYEASDYARTTDERHNIIRVGDELSDVLEQAGLHVLHDRGLYDYPHYTGSYTRSGEAVENYLKEYPSLRIVLDVHRDAIGDGDTVYKTLAEIPGTPCAQVMILAGTGENGLEHPNWQENLKLALLLQASADARCPTLMRPLAVRKERYNQQLTTGSLILEVGSNGNTLQEAITAVRLFGSAIAPALLELVGPPA
jgi:stage II sporulation protein P